MDRFPVGNAVSLDIPFVDDNANPLEPTAVAYTLTDENDAVITGPTAIAGPYDAATTVVIPGNLNTPAGARRVELAITTTLGVFYVYASYQVRDNNARLVILTNSFQTLLQAQLTANDTVNLSNWDGATDDLQVGALAEAFYRLTRFAYLIRWPEYVDTQNIYLQDMHARITPQMWPVMTQALFVRYPVQFQAALKKAQIIEANSVLAGDVIGDKRRSGILKDKVGESEQTFRGGIRPLDMGICREALNAIRTYLDFRLTLTRAP